LTSNNTLSTSIFRKPMSKHEYLHFMSNHPDHMKKSIIFSQGLRIIRSCSEPKEREIQIHALLNKFKYRLYPIRYINEALVKLNALNRSSALAPQTSLLRSSLNLHHPNILLKYKDFYKPKDSNFSDSDVFVVIPFYKSVFNLQSIFLETLTKGMNDCSDPKFIPIIKELKLKLAFSRTKNLKEILRQSNK
jgi:hypothetical protein